MSLSEVVFNLPLHLCRVLEQSKTLGSSLLLMERKKEQDDRILEAPLGTGLVTAYSQ